jgi:SAM-dependent methyltransferase
MPSIEQNKKKWTADSEWEHKGDQWSEAWGGPLNQWSSAIYPRISRFLPCDSILEIAPGYGRWTNFLKDHCRRLTGIDLNQNCVDYCRNRFADSPSLVFDTNDGRSLAAVPDHSIDFVFSFDSLVHAEADVLSEYIAQLPRVLKPSGAVFLHHSNFGAYRTSKALMSIPVIRNLSSIHNLLGSKRNIHWRAASVTASLVREMISKSGLYCAKQELINWSTDYLNDCFTTVTVASSDLQILENYGFMKEAEIIRKSNFLG